MAEPGICGAEAPDAAPEPFGPRGRALASPVLTGGVACPAALRFIVAMTTMLFSHDASMEHLTPPGHPERPARHETIMRALSTPQFAALERAEAPACEDDEILRCHPASHLEAVRDAIPDEGMRSLDADTHVSPGSLEAARRAAGGCCAAVDAVLSGAASNAFVAARPPGHHAEKSRAMGFCLFGSVAIAAMRALDHHGLDRVAVVDFDVHHGNGTQDLLWNEPRAMFCSSHQMPLYPGTGRADETGASGNVLNLPLEPSSGGREMRLAWDETIFPALEEFGPELVLVSAGFDAHRDDPLAQLEWTEEDFAWLSGRICDVAETHACGRLVSSLEGGYDLDALAASVVAHVELLMERGK